MKKIPLLLCLFLTACGSLYTRTPVVNPTTGTTNYQYEISPGTSNILHATGETVRAVPDVSPVVTIGKEAALGVLSLVTLALIQFARIKTRASQEHSDAADLLAATVVKAGAQKSALEIASGTKSVGLVAKHIDNNEI